MHILMVLDHRFPPDDRVENEALALHHAGFRVTVLAIGPDERPAVEQHRGLCIRRARIPRSLRDKMRGLVTTIPLMDYYLVRKIMDIHKETPLDALHMHDLYLFGGGLRAGKALQIPVVGDLHENWVEALKVYAWSTRFPGKCFVSFRRWTRAEREWVNTVDRLVVVVEEAAQRNISLGVSPNRITVVPNTAHRPDFDRYKVEESLVSTLRQSAELTLMYTGGYDLHRGLDTVIRALPAIVAQIPRTQFVIVGSGRITEELKALAKAVGVSDNVRFEGWQPQERLKSYILGSDICLVPHLRNGHTDATVPHKLFHYMYLGKPVVVSDCPPLKRIVEETQAGLVFNGGDTHSLAMCIGHLVKNKDEAYARGLNGHRSVVEKYNWETTVQELVNMYRDLESSRST